MYISPQVENFVILDSVDRAGKDSTYDRLIPLSGYRFQMCMRSPISNLVYARIYKRNINTGFYWNLLRHLLDFPNAHFIYLYANKEDLIKRCIATNETDLDPNTYDLHLNTFRDLINEAVYFGIFNENNYYEVNTSLKNQDEVAQDVYNHIVNPVLYRNC